MERLWKSIELGEQISDARQPTLRTEGWGTHKGKSRSLTIIRKRRGYHPNTRKTGVCLGAPAGFGMTT